MLESVSWFHGKHAFKVGFEFRAGGNAEVRDRGSSGSFTFSPLYHQQPAARRTPATRWRRSCSAR